MLTEDLVLIDINNNINCKCITFPDGQPHVELPEAFDSSSVKVVVRIKSANDLIHLLELSNALDNLFCTKEVLHIPYLMGARSDRNMTGRSSIDIKVIANLINSCGFKKIVLYDIHSDASLLLINNSINTSNHKLVKTYYNIPNSILICPDAGAAKKAGKYMDLNSAITEVVYCNKDRDLATGEITLRVLEPERCRDRKCIIIDDLCDGGGTFLKIRGQIAPKYMTLMVTHGIFSKGLEVFVNKFDEIITTNSYFEPHSIIDSCLLYSNIKLTTIDITNNINSHE